MNRNCASGTRAAASTQQLDALVRLEVARVEDHGLGPEAELAAQRRDGLRRRAARAGPRAAGPRSGTRGAPGARPLHAFGEARADRDHRGRVRAARGVSRRLGQPGQRAPRARSPSSGAGRGSTSPRPPPGAGRSRRANGRREVGRLLDGVDDVVAAEGHARQQASAMNGTSSSELGQRRPRPHAAHGQPSGCADGAGPGTSTSSPCGKVSRSTWWPSAGERPHHGQHRERRPPHLEERLRREEQDAKRAAAEAIAQWLRKRSASMAAMQPLPAAVTACR